MRIRWELWIVRLVWTRRGCIHLLLWNRWWQDGRPQRNRSNTPRTTFEALCVLSNMSHSVLTSSLCESFITNSFQYAHNYMNYITNCNIILTRIKSVTFRIVCYIVGFDFTNEWHRFWTGMDKQTTVATSRDTPASVVLRLSQFPQ